jgi:hypothetical protein
MQTSSASQVMLHSKLFQVTSTPSYFQVPCRTGIPRMNPSVLSDLQQLIILEVIVSVEDRTPGNSSCDKHTLLISCLACQDCSCVSCDFAPLEVPPGPGSRKDQDA